MAKITEDALKIVKAMGDYLPDYISIRDKVAGKLEETARDGDDVFTSHGYGHCVRIFRCINNLAEGCTDFYQHIKDEELFYLGVSILLHDYVMTKNPKLRKTHSISARKELVSSFFKMKEDPVISLFSPLNDLQTDIVTSIISAHSDPKDEDDNVLFRTLEEIKNKENSGGNGIVKTNLLAALLRLGDELDCTSARLEDQKLVGETQRLTNEHWRKCALILEIMPPISGATNKNKIFVKIHDQMFNTSDDKFNDVELIDSVLLKLQTSLDEVNTLVFDNHASAWWHYNSVLLTEECENTLSAYRSQRDVGINEPVVEPNIEGTVRNNQVDLGFVVVPDANMSEQLKEWVIKHKLFGSGHFEISTDRHVRDWIYTSKLLEDNDYFSPIINSFVDLVRRLNIDPRKTIVVGEGFPGLLIASQLAFSSGMGGSYVIPSSIEAEHLEQEKLIDIPDGFNVILASDVIADGETLLESIEILVGKCGVKEDQIIIALSIFYRPSSKEVVLPEYLKGKIFALNADFSIQKCGKTVKDCLLANKGLVHVVKNQ